MKINRVFQITGNGGHTDNIIASKAYFFLIFTNKKLVESIYCQRTSKSAQYKLEKESENEEMYL